VERLLYYKDKGRARHVFCPGHTGGPGWTLNTNTELEGLTGPSGSSDHIFSPPDPQCLASKATSSTTYWASMCRPMVPSPLAHTHSVSHGP
jgi:hypothetical protein